MNHLSGGGVIKPNVSLIKEDNSVNYIPLGVDINISIYSKNESPYIFKINGKEYQTTNNGNKSDRNEYYHSLITHIFDNKIILQSITQENSELSYCHVFKTDLKDYLQPLPSDEFTAYLQNNSIDLSKLTSEQSIAIIKATSIEYDSDYKWYTYYYGKIQSGENEYITLQNHFTVNDLSQIKAISFIILPSID